MELRHLKYFQAVAEELSFSKAPRLVHTPSLIGTVLQYVEAGAGLGIVPESVLSESDRANVKLIPLTPRQTIPLVMVWSKDGDDPSVMAFRALIKEWLAAGKL